MKKEKNLHFCSGIFPPSTKNITSSPIARGKIGVDKKRGGGVPPPATIIGFFKR